MIRDAHIKRIRELLPAARKLVKILEESESLYDHKRHQLIRLFASGVDRRNGIERDDDLLAAYEKTRAYRSAIAKKAAKTRKKNESEAAAQAPVE